MDFTPALSHFGQATYVKAAFAFIRLGCAEGLGGYIISDSVTPFQRY